MMKPLQKFGMKLMWRLQAIGALYSVVMLTITLTLVVYPYVNWRFFDVFDSIGLDFGTQSDIVITAIIFVVIVSAALTFGFVYDRILKLWKTSNQVAMERNPYAKNLMNPKEVLNWQYYFVPMLRASGCQKEAEFMEKWNQRVLNENPELKKEVAGIMKWIDAYKLPAPEKRHLHPDLEAALASLK